MLDKLPLKEDFEEHEAVVKCLAHLYQLGHPALTPHIPALIRVCCLIIHEKKGNDSTYHLRIISCFRTTVALTQWYNFAPE